MSNGNRYRRPRPISVKIYDTVEELLCTGLLCMLTYYATKFLFIP